MMMKSTLHTNRIWNIIERQKKDGRNFQAWMSARGIVYTRLVKTRNISENKKEIWCSQIYIVQGCKGKGNLDVQFSRQGNNEFAKKYVLHGKFSGTILKF